MIRCERRKLLTFDRGAFRPNKKLLFQKVGHTRERIAVGKTFVLKTLNAQIQFQNIFYLND